MIVIASKVIPLLGSVGNIFGVFSEEPTDPNPPSPPPKIQVEEEQPLVVVASVAGPYCEIEEDCWENYEICIDPYRVYLSHIEGKGLGYPIGFTSFGFFVAGGELINEPRNKFAPFLDLRANVFNKGKFAADVGLGVRYINYCDYICGLNLFYDARKGELKWYQQIGGGLEFFIDSWTVRGNFYLPFAGRKKYSSPKTFNYEDGYRVIFRKREEALRGADIELGYSCRVPCEDFSFYGGIGQYFFKRVCSQDIVGGFGRLVINAWDCLALEGRFYYDAINRFIAQGKISLTFSFGRRARNQCVLKCKECCPEDIAFFREIAASPVRRNEVIYVDERCAYENFDPSGNLTRFSLVDRRR